MVLARASIKRSVDSKSSKVKIDTSDKKLPVGQKVAPGNFVCIRITLVELADGDKIIGGPRRDDNERSLLD